MKVKAHAKINLRLKVLGTNNKNYHLLQMVNAKVGLHDTLFFRRIKKPILVVKQKGLEQENNIVYKILKIMFDKYQLSGGIIVNVRKRIPYGAGLAGGSVDAAASIKAINEIYQLQLTKDQMKDIALQLGTDIVYALHNGICLVEGIGDKVTHLSNKFKNSVLIINPNIIISTKEIYQECDKYSYSLPNKIEEIESWNIKELLENDLEQVAFTKYPQVLDLKEFLIKESNLPTIMSGSGSSVYVVGNRKELIELLKKVKKQYPSYKGYLTYIQGE